MWKVRIVIILLSVKGAYSLVYKLWCVQGHTDELWGLDVHPSMEQFVTCSQDKQVHLWDTNSHQPLWSKTIEVTVWSWNIRMWRTEKSLLLRVTCTHSCCLCSRIQAGLQGSIPAGRFWLWEPWLEGRPHSHTAETPHSEQAAQLLFTTARL